jgi:hypothetical protein
VVPVDGNAQTLTARKVAVHVIGGAKQPRNLMLAMSEAEEVARSI